MSQGGELDAVRKARTGLADAIKAMDDVLIVWLHHVDRFRNAKNELAQALSVTEGPSGTEKSALEFEWSQLVGELNPTEYHMRRAIAFVRHRRED